MENVASTKADATYPIMPPKWDECAHASASCIRAASIAIVVDGTRLICLL